MLLLSCLSTFIGRSGPGGAERRWGVDRKFNSISWQQLEQWVIVGSWHSFPFLLFSRCNAVVVLRCTSEDGGNCTLMYSFEQQRYDL